MHFTGGVAGGTSIWTTIETLCNNVVVPIAGFILTIILLNDLIQTVLRGNNFKDFDDSIIIKWIIKALCGVILVSNTYYIASALFGFGTSVCANGLATLFGTGEFLDTALALNKSALGEYSLGELMTVWFISLIVHLGVMILIVAIVITLASRIIEIFMYLSIARAYGNDDGRWGMVGYRQKLDKTAAGVIISGIFYHCGTRHFQDFVCQYDYHAERRNRKCDYANGDAFGLHGCIDIHDSAYRSNQQIGV